MHIQQINNIIKATLISKTCKYCHVYFADMSAAKCDEFWENWDSQLTPAIKAKYGITDIGEFKKCCKPRNV